MNLFARQPGFTQTPPGLERKILRHLSRWLWQGSFILALPSLLVRLISSDPEALSIMTTDIYVAGLVVLHWTVLFTVGIGAFIVMMMKGPAYIADAYPLDEADAPDQPPTSSKPGNPLS